MTRKLNLPHPAKHGEFVPGKGWYDANNRWWRDNPQSIGALVEPPKPSAAAREEFERQQAKARGDFKPNPQMERLIELRDSDRPDDRAKYERIAHGTTAMTLGRYETAKRAAEGNK